MSAMADNDMRLRERLEERAEARDPLAAAIESLCIIMEHARRWQEPERFGGDADKAMRTISRVASESVLEVAQLIADQTRRRTDAGSAFQLSLITRLEAMR